MDAGEPDVTVAVDLGTTYTGVAWMTPRTAIQVINNWPGSGDHNERKVPTVLVYDARGAVSSWGFLCADDDIHDGNGGNGKTRHEFFKIFMDADTLAGAQQQGIAGAPASVLEAQRFCADYLREVYRHVKDTVESEMGRRHSGGWAGLRVEFLFSVPTTWTTLGVVNAFKDVIRRAGFGSESPRHTALVDLTEAEAAAVATLKTSAVVLDAGSVFLTVDAGGGTTDLALMRVTASANRDAPQMASMHPVTGVGIGASVIDRQFVRLVAQRIAACPPDVVAMLPPDVATRLARSHPYYTLKHKFGEGAYMQGPYRLLLEGVAHTFSHPAGGIENGKMIFSVHEIQALFDQQVEGIVRKITEELDWLKSGHTEQVRYLILSGGLGSSTYVRDQLQSHFTTHAHPAAVRVEVLRSGDPQLVVVRGLLLDRQQARQQHTRTGAGPSPAPVLATRTARASYGVIMMHAFMQGRHEGEDLVRDAHEPDKVWALNQIDWLVRKGEAVAAGEARVQRFNIRLAAGELTRAWDTVVVVSHNEPRSLPWSLKQGGATKLCVVRSNLTGLRQEQLVHKHKRGTCTKRGYTFYICEFEVRVIVAPADLRFELWFGGRRFSGNHEPIAVQWDEAGTRARGGG